jgi:hypothetical protein
MGRCQGGFCTPKVMEILEREGAATPLTLSKAGPGSELVFSLRHTDAATVMDAREEGR